MELWTRSQARTNLVQIKQISLNYQNNKQVIANYKPEQYENSSCSYELLGTYKTKERALEVLDEIQKLLQPIYKVTNDFKKSELTGNCQWIEKQEYIPIQTKVYQMPEN